HDAVGERRELLGAVRSDEEIVLEPQAAAAFPVDTGLDRQHHPRLDRAAGGLVSVGRLVRARTDTVADRVARLARVASCGDTVAHEAIEHRERSAWTAVLDRMLVDFQQLPLELGVLGAQ